MCLKNITAPEIRGCYLFNFRKIIVFAVKVISVINPVD